MNRRYSFADVVVVISLLAIGIYSPFLLPKTTDATSLVVRTPDGTQSLSMLRDQVVEVEGKSGLTVIEVESGKARILRSSCPNNYRHEIEGWISQAGAALACVPNQIVLDLSGDGFDSVMR